MFQQGAGEAGKPRQHSICVPAIIRCGLVPLRSQQSPGRAIHNRYAVWAGRRRQGGRLSTHSHNTRCKSVCRTLTESHFRAGRSVSSQHTLTLGCWAASGNHSLALLIFHTRTLRKPAGWWCVHATHNPPRQRHPAPRRNGHKMRGAVCASCAHVATPHRTTPPSRPCALRPHSGRKNAGTVFERSTPSSAVLPIVLWVIRDFMRDR